MAKTPPPPPPILQRQDVPPPGAGFAQPPRSGYGGPPRPESSNPLGPQRPPGQPGQGVAANPAVPPILQGTFGTPSREPGFEVKPAQTGFGQRPPGSAGPPRPPGSAGPPRPPNSAVPPILQGNTGSAGTPPPLQGFGNSPGPLGGQSVPPKVLGSAGPPRPPGSAGPPRPPGSAGPPRPPGSAGPPRPFSSAAPPRPPDSAAPPRPPDSAAPPILQGGPGAAGAPPPSKGPGNSPGQLGGQSVPQGQARPIGPFGQGGGNPGNPGVYSENPKAPPSSARGGPVAPPSARGPGGAGLGPPSKGPGGISEMKIEGNRIICNICHRKFNEDRIQVHTAICKKTTNSKRPIFDSAKQRLGELMGEKEIRRVTNKAKKPPKFEKAQEMVPRKKPVVGRLHPPRPPINRPRKRQNARKSKPKWTRVASSDIHSIFQSTTCSTTTDQRNRTEQETATSNGGILPSSNPSTPALLRYLTAKNFAPNDPTESFFQSIAATVKKMSPYHQNMCKSKIFNIVSELEVVDIFKNPTDEINKVFAAYCTPGNKCASVPALPTQPGQLPFNVNCNEATKSGAVKASALCLPNVVRSVQRIPVNPATNCVQIDPTFEQVDPNTIGLEYSNVIPQYPYGYPPNIPEVYTFPNLVYNFQQNR